MLLVGKQITPTHPYLIHINCIYYCNYTHYEYFEYNNNLNQHIIITNVIIISSSNHNCNLLLWFCNSPNSDMDYLQEIVTGCFKQTKLRDLDSMVHHACIQVLDFVFIFVCISFINIYI